MSRISRMNTRFTERVNDSRTVRIRSLSSFSKFAKWCRPPPVKKPSYGLAEYFRSSASSSSADEPHVRVREQLVEHEAGEWSRGSVWIAASVCGCSPAKRWCRSAMISR